MAVNRRITSSDVAREAGVSKWTVTRAFTPGASIAPESRERVLSAAEKLGYRPNLLARSLATKRTQQVAVLIDDFANPAKLPFLAQLTLALQNEETVMMLININQHHDHVDALLNADQRQVDAAILFGTDFRDVVLEENGGLSPRLPVFVLARESMTSSIPAVSCDSDIAIREICAHLVARGYRHPGFMTGPRTLSTALGRRRHFCKFWEDAGIPHVPILAAGNYERTAAMAALRKYLQATPETARIDVLMCENDALAMGAVDAARWEFGLRIPDDLAIVGFDGFEQTASPSYDLTTYQQPIVEMVDAIVAMALNRIPRESLKLRGSLLVRGST
jgi:LacI family transcriptional regulator